MDESVEQSPPAGAMSPDELALERRRGRYAGVAAILAGICFPAGLFWTQIASNDRPEHNNPAELRFFHRHADALVASSVLRSTALLLLAVVAVYLYRATKARKPDLSKGVLVLALAGPLTLALGGLVHDVYLAAASADFAGREFQTIDGARDLVRGPVAVTTVGLSIAGTLALALWFVLGSLNAMRVGLLSRFMGVLGVIVGPAFVFGLAPLVLTFWLIALGFLLFGLWPRGRPPAWEVGQALPWLSSRRLADEDAGEEAEEEGGSRNGEVEPIGPGVHKMTETAPLAPPAGSRRRKPLRVLGAMALVAAANAVMLAGCGLKKEVDTTRAEATIKRGLVAQTGDELRRVNCPSDVEAKQGDVFRCVAVASDGSRIPIRVTQVDGEGGVRWQIAR
jgi:hypothetical protein